MDSDIFYLYMQRLLQEAEKTPNVVKATNRPRLYEELEDIQGRFVLYIYIYMYVVVHCVGISI